MQTQTNLDDLGSFKIKSSRSDREYRIEKVNGRWTCDGEHCRKMVLKGLYCRHIWQHLQETAININAYLEQRKQFESSAEFDTFEESMAAIQTYKSEEMNYICNVILSLAVHRGSVFSDDVYDVLGGKFVSSPNVLGNCWGILVKRKWIRCIGRARSLRETNHGADGGIYVLTEMGWKAVGRAVFGKYSCPGNG